MTSERDEAIFAAVRACNDMGSIPVEGMLEAAIEAYESAMLESGWKMTPRIMNDAMVTAANQARNKPMAWAAAWDAAPSPGDEG